MIFCRSHSETLNESTIVGVKTVRSRGRGSRAVDSWINGNRNEGDDVLPRLGPLDGGKTLRPALVYINGVSSTELIYLEIIYYGLDPRGMMSNVIMI